MHKLSPQGNEVWIKWKRQHMYSRQEDVARVKQSVILCRPSELWENVQSLNACLEMS